MDWRSPPLPALSPTFPIASGTHLLIGWLKTDPWPPWFDRLVLMFQREVAERIVAKPRTKDYGRLAVLAQWRTRPRLLFTVPAAAFTPRPKVNSALVELVPKETPEPHCSVEALERVTAAAFGQRRKMLRSSLRQLTPDSEAPAREPRHRSERARRGACRI